MFKKLATAIRQNKTIMKVFAVLGALIFSGLANGAWEYGIHPFFKAVGRVILRIGTYLSDSFSDSLYESVGRDGVNSISIGSYVFIMISFIIIFLMDHVVRNVRLLIQIPVEDRKDIAEFGSIGTVVLDKVFSHDGARRRASSREALTLLIAMMKLLSMSFVLMVVFQFVSSTYIYSASNYIERCIEIISPKVTEMEGLEMRAEYRSIKNSDDFVRLQDRVKKIAASATVELPEFSPILRRQH